MTIECILNIVNDAYENGEARINEDICDDERGDGLASFIRNEIIEVCDGNSSGEMIAIAATAMRYANDQISRVVNELENRLTD